MADPQEVARGLYQPGVGSDVGTWYLPLNGNFGATGSMFGNVATIGLTNANVTLSTPPNAGSAWSGPYQSQSAILRFTGTLSGNCTITIPAQGFFIVENLCTVGAFYVALASSAPGQIICAPPGEACHIYCDGVNVKYVNLGRVGSYFDQAVATVPAWITNSTVPPFLSCDGTVYTATAVYGVGNPAPLLNLLGSTFGGNGITTFGVPDLRSRTRLSLGGASNRITVAGGNYDGNTLNTAGGAQNHTQTIAELAAHPHSTTDPGHSHGVSGGTLGGQSSQACWVGGGAFSGQSAVTVPTTITINSAQTGITINNAGSSTPFTVMNPSLVSGMTFIKT